MSDMTIKARKTGATRFAFVTPEGRLNHLRIHAAQYKADKVNEAIETLRRDNPGWEFKAAPGWAS